MQSKVVKTLALALVLGGVSMSAAQPSGQQSAGPSQQGGLPPGSPKQKAVQKKSNLEEMLAQALKNNPDIRVAAAKLAEADAELNRTRLQVTQKVVMLYHAIETQKKVVENAERREKRAENLGAAISSEGKDEITQSLALAKAKLAELEAQVPALLGKARSSAAGEASRPRVRYRLGFDNDGDVDGELDLLLAREGKLDIPQAKVNIPQAEKIRKALQTPVRVDFKDMTFDAILSDLAKTVEGLSFRNLFQRGDNFAKMNLRFEGALPLSAILQALTDETGCTFYVRDYGILAIRRDSVPPGAMTVEDFLRQKPVKDPAVTINQDPWSSLPWKPPENIEGTVKKISSDGSVVISFNSVDGLLQGHTLYLYRPADEPSKAKYLGRVQIFNSLPFQPQSKEMLGRPIGKLSEPPKLGDKVSARMPSSAKNPPGEEVEGRVKAVDASGLMTITIGSDAGLSKGHTLELFRMATDPPHDTTKYLGTIRVLEAHAKESVCQAVGKLGDKPKVGDNVSVGWILGN